MMSVSMLKKMTPPYFIDLVPFLAFFNITPVKHLNCLLQLFYIVCGEMNSAVLGKAV